MGVVKISRTEHPFCFSGLQYAKDVVSGKIPNSKYVIGACQRFLDDLELGKYPFDVEYAERFLRLVQNFDHIVGNWKTKNIIYLPWQNFTLMCMMGFKNPETGFRRFRNAHIEISRGQGKAHPLNQTVPTPEGFKKWSEICVGSRLYSRDGNICKVVAKTPIQDFEVYEVGFSDGSKVLCSSGHEWVVSSKAQRDKKNHHKHNPPKRLNKNGLVVADSSYESCVETIEIKNNLKLGKETNYLISNCKPTEGFKNFDKGLDPYYVGYWLGNGSTRASSLTCHTKDLENLVELFRSRGIKISSTQTKKGTNGVKINVLETLTKLKENSLYGNKHFKEDWIFCPVPQRLELLRGFMDSDGSIFKDQTCHFYNSNLDLVVGVQSLLNSLGIKTTLLEKKVSKNNNYKTSKKHYYVSFSTNPEVRVFNLKRKFERQKSKNSKHEYCSKRYITSVKATGQHEKMFCVTVDSKDNTYLVGEQFIPTHNSTLASQIGLFFLAMDNPKGNTISCFATKNEQARIVLDSSRAMAKGNPSFLSKFGVKVLAHKIVQTESNSSMRAMSSDSKSLDGLSDILAIIDELHSITQELFDVVSSGMSKRSDSLLLCITTAGTNVEGVGFSQSTYAKKVALGEIEDDQFFSIVYCAEEGDDLFSEETWKKANPSYGYSVDPITFKAKALKAQEIPADLKNFKIKHLNMWVQEYNAFFDVAKWEVLGDVASDISNFKGKQVRIGVDIASHIDLTSLAYIFRQDGKYFIFDKTYIPEETVKKVKSTIYENCIGKGHLIQTKGEALDQEILRTQILEDNKTFKIQDILLDPWNAVALIQFLQNKGMNVTDFRMNVSNLSEPTKRLDALIRQGKIVHNGSPLLKWCLGNVVVKYDAADNVFPRKTHEKLKIDPIIAIIMSLASHIQDELKVNNVESIGIRFL